MRSAPKNLGPSLPQDAFEWSGGRWSYPLIRDLERRGILRPGFTSVIEAGSADVGVAKPLLHFGDVGLVVEGVGSSRCRKGVDAETGQVHTSLHGVEANHTVVDRSRGEGFVQVTGDRVFHRTEQGTARLFAVASSFQVVVDSFQRACMDGNVAQLATFAVDPQMEDTTAFRRRRIRQQDLPVRR